MQDNSVFQQSANVVTQLCNENTEAGNVLDSLSEKVEHSTIEQSLKVLLFAYLQSPSPENFETLKSKCDALIKVRRMLLTVGRYAESQVTLSTLSLISAVVAEKGTPEQHAQFSFLALMRQALAELREFSAKLTTEDWVAITIIWDEWLFSALPACLRVNSYHADRPECFSGLLACLLIQQVAGKVEPFATLVSEMRTAAIDLLQLKGKRFYLKAWLDEVFAKKAGFDWRAHREKQNKNWGSILSLEDIYSLFDNDQPLLIELRDIAKLDSSLEALKSLDYLKRPEEKDIAAILLQMEALADTLSARAKLQESRYWRERTMNALMCYSGILFTLTNPRWKIDNRVQETVRQRVIEKIKELELNLLVGANAQYQQKHVWKNDSRYLKQLEAYRKKARAELLTIIAKEASNDKQRLKRAEQLDSFSQSIIIFMKEFVGRLIAASIADLGPAPCQYAFIGFGSFEKQSMTPYSDLEFGILIQEDSERNREYFRNLTFILQAKVIQLGETPIPTSLFDHNLDHLTNAGFSFDLGGKISLGRCYDEYDLSAHSNDPKKYGTLKYELIGTPEQLLRFIEDDYFLVDKLLPVELGHCAFIVGDFQLFTQYQQLLVSRMCVQDQQGKLFYQHRAMTYLQGNRLLEGDLDKYMPKLDHSKDGQLFDVKKEIYRLPDRLISDLALFFGIMVGSTLQKINQLVEKKVITEKNAVHLKIMDGIAKEIRFSTYFYYGGQLEHLSVVPLLFKEDNSLFRLNNMTVIERFYRSAFPYQRQLQFICSIWEKTPLKALELLQNSEFNDFSLEIQMKIARRLGQHEKAQTLLVKMQKNHSDPRNEHILHELASSYFSSRNYTRALDYFKQLLEIQERYWGKYHVLVAGTLVNLGNVYCALGDRQQHVSMEERALKILELAFAADRVELVSNLVSLGNAYGALGYRQQQVSVQERALKILERAFGANHVDVARTLVNLGIAYGALGDRQQQVTLQERALTIKERAYGPDHVEVANTLMNLGNAYGHLGDYRKNASLQEWALKIQERAFGANHVDLAATLVNLGDAYGALGDYQQQLSQQERALKILERASRADDVGVADTLESLGNAYSLLGDYPTQMRLQERALKIKEQAFGAGHQRVASTLVNLASAYGNLGDPEQQVSMQERAIKILEQAFDAHHMDVAATLVNLGNAYGALGDYYKQKSLQKRALKIQKQAFGGDHVEVAATLLNLGNAYGDLGDYSKRASLQERALQIFEREFGADHVQVARTLMNLGNAYGALGNYYKQKSLQKRALQIEEKAYGMEHVNVAYTLSYIGYSLMRETADLSSSQQYLERALHIYELPNNQDDPGFASTLRYLGHVYGEQGKLDKKTEFLERALLLHQAKLPPKDPQLVITLVVLGRPPQDQVLLKKALDFQKKYGPHHPLVSLIEQTIQALPPVEEESANKEGGDNIASTPVNSLVALPAHAPNSPAALMAGGGFFNNKGLSEAYVVDESERQIADNEQKPVSAEHHEYSP